MQDGVVEEILVTEDNINHSGSRQLVYNCNGIMPVYASYCIVVVKYLVVIMTSTSSVKTQ